MRKDRAPRWMVMLTGMFLVSTVGCMGHTSLGEDGGAGGEAAGGGGAVAGGGAGGQIVGGSGGGGSGSGAAPLTCPASLSFDDGLSPGLSAGPQNRQLLAPRMFNEAVLNYQDNIVFEGALKAGGAFEQVGGDPTLGPDSGAELEPFLGQVALVPPACAGADVSGRTLTVRYLVRLTGAIVQRPPHGAFLGSAHDDTFTFYEDAVSDGDIINTLAAQTLEHTFTAAEAEDVAENGVFFNLYTAEPLPIDLYIDEIVWN